MTEHDLLAWLIPAFGTVICVVGVGILDQLKRLGNHIEKLSINMATIAERVNSHEKRISRLESD